MRIADSATHCQPQPRHLSQNERVDELDAEHWVSRWEREAEATGRSGFATAARALLVSFRSEDHVLAWLAGRAPGATIPVKKLADLANAWWGDRLAMGLAPAHARAESGDPRQPSD